MRRTLAGLALVPMVASLGVVTAPSAHAATQYCAQITPLSQRPVLRSGDTGWCVQELQSRLQRRGYAVRQTHTFNSTTLAAVRRFQQSRHLPVTGVVDARTWRALMGGTQEIPAYTRSSQYIQQRGPNHTGRIVLSFDDCPSSYRSFKTMVDAAARMKVTIVLAPTGACQAGSTFSASYARSKGHIVIGHSRSHPNLRKLSDAGIRSQVDTASRTSHYMRPPYGSWDARVTRVLAGKGVRLWGWTRDSGDWSGRSQSTIVRYITSTSRPNDTILLHMQWHAFNPTALAQIKSGLAKRHLALCHAYVGRTAPVALPSQLPC